MAHYCAFDGCLSRYEDKMHTFYVFPKDRNLCQTWCSASNLTFSGDIVTATRRKKICALHFKSGDFLPYGKLNPAAIPSRNVSPTTVPPTVVPASVPQPSVSNISQHPSVIEYKAAMDAQIEEHRKEIRKLKNEIRQLQTDNDSLRRKVADTSSPKISPNDIEQYFARNISMATFIKMQVERYGKKCARKYNAMEQTIAITLFHACKAKGYRTLQHIGILLPSLRSIRRWLCKLRIGVGSNEDIVSCLRMKMAQMNEFEKDCVLAFDETKIESGIFYEKSKDCYVGLEDLGPGSISSGKPATQALVFSLRGATTNWKFPLRYYFVHKSCASPELKRLLFECIHEATDCGANVLAVVPDQSSPNRGLANALGITVENPTFEFDGRRLVFLYDAPHLLKCLRNTLLNHGFNGELDEEGVCRPTINIEHVRKFYEQDQRATLPSAPKLKQRHFEPNRFEKMKVNLAANLLSGSVYAGMMTMIDMGELDASCTSTAMFCKKVNDLFDMLNTSTKDDANPLKAGNKIFDNIPKLEELYEWVTSLKQFGPYIPTIKGTKITIRGIILLLKELQSRGYKYVFTRRFQSDMCEHIFSLIKVRSGGNPTTIKFKEAYKSMFVGTLLRSPLGSNCEVFEEDLLSLNEERIKFLLELQAKKPCPTLTEILSGTDSSHDENGDLDETCDVDENEDDDKDVQLFRDLQYLSSNATSESVAIYMGGWAIKKCIRISGCKNCKNLLLEDQMDRQDSSLEMDECLLLHKAQFEVQVPTTSSFGLLLKEDTKVVFRKLNSVIGLSFYKSLDATRNNVMKNLVKQLESYNVVKKWLKVDNFPNCGKHRYEMLELFMRACIYGFFKRKTDEMKSKIVAEELE